MLACQYGRVQENADRTSAFVVLIYLLRPMGSSKFAGRQQGTTVVRNQKFLDLVVKCLIKLTKVCFCYHHIHLILLCFRLGVRVLTMWSSSNGRFSVQLCLRWTSTEFSKVFTNILKSWEWQKYGKGISLWSVNTMVVAVLYSVLAHFNLSIFLVLIILRRELNFNPFSASSVL